MPRSSRNSYRALLEIAERQQGLFTAKQAEEAGYSAAARVYQVKCGNWNRKIRGVYQLAIYPNTKRPDLVLWSLWSRNVKDIPQGVYSHQTGLVIHELTDLQPARLHMTVPDKFRRRSSIPDILVLHRQDLQKEDVIDMEGYRVTSPLKTIEDLYRSETVAPNILREALQQGLDQGLIPIMSLRNPRGSLLASQLGVKAP